MFTVILGLVVGFDTMKYIGDGHPLPDWFFLFAGVTMMLIGICGAVVTVIYLLWCVWLEKPLVPEFTRSVGQ